MPACPCPMERPRHSWKSYASENSLASVRVRLRYQAVESTRPCERNCYLLGSLNRKQKPSQISPKVTFVAADAKRGRKGPFPDWVKDAEPLPGSGFSSSTLRRFAGISAE